MSTVTKTTTYISRVFTEDPASKTFTVPSGTTRVKVCLIGGGGSGAPTMFHGDMGNEHNRGGGGGGGGAVAYGEIEVEGGDQLVMDIGPTAPRLALGYNLQEFGKKSSVDGGAASITKGNITYSAGGGKSGGDGIGKDPTPGGAGGTASIPAAADFINWNSIPGGKGGDGQVPPHADPSDPTATLPGKDPEDGGIETVNTFSFPGKAGTKATNSQLFTHPHAAGGGGGTFSGIPDWALEILTGADRGLSYTSTGGKGGDGGNGTTTDPGADGVTWRNRSRNVYNPALGAVEAKVDGQDSSDKVIRDGLDDGQVGTGGGGAGIPNMGDTENPEIVSGGVGGGGGPGLIALQYEYLDDGPLIVINGDNPMSIEVGGVYTEQGAYAKEDDPAADTVGATLPVTTTGSVNTDVAGQYQIAYSATNHNGKEATVRRTVNVTNDATPPVINLVGGTIYHPQGIPFADPGADATDNVDTQVTVTSDAQLVVKDVVGTYVVTYTAKDSQGNTATTTRKVIITAGGAPDPVAGPPTNTPTGAGDKISLADIHRASQLWKSGALSVVKTNAQLFNRDVMLSYLRDTMYRDGFSGGSTVKLASTPGGSSLPSTDKDVHVSAFRDMSRLSYRLRWKPETWEVYRSSSDGALEVTPQGSSGDTAYSVTLTIANPDGEKYPKDKQSQTVNNVGQGAPAVFTNLGGNVSGPGPAKGTDDTARTSDAGDAALDGRVEIYWVVMSWTNPGGTGPTVYDNTAITIGQSTTTYRHGQETPGTINSCIVNIDAQNDTDPTATWWVPAYWDNGVNKNKAGKWSDYLTVYPMTQEYER